MAVLLKCLQLQITIFEFASDQIRWESFDFGFWILDFRLGIRLLIVDC